MSWAHGFQLTCVLCILRRILGYEDEFEDLITSFNKLEDTFEQRKASVKNESHIFVSKCPDKCKCFSPMEVYGEGGWAKVEKPRDHRHFHDGDMWAVANLLHIYPRCRFLVDCSEAGLASLPTLPNETDCVMMENNPGIGAAWAAESLTDETRKHRFRHAFPQSLKLLDIFGLALGDLPSGTFAGYTELRVLSLEGNKLKHLHEGLFQDMPRLQYLDLSGNQVGQERGTPLVWAAHELMANRIEHVPRNLFSANADLRYLNLSNNRITSLDIECFATNVELRLLALWGNPLLLDLRSRDAAIYKPLHKLHSVSFGDREEDMTLHADWFVDVGQLEQEL